MYRNAKKRSEMSQILVLFSGKFLNFGKSARVKDLTNIMSTGSTTERLSSMGSIPWIRCASGNVCLPGMISAVNLVALLSPPSRTMESGREERVQAV